MIRKFIFSLLLGAAFTGAASEKFTFSEQDIKSLGLRFEPVQLRIPGVKKTYRFLWMADLHVMAQDVSEIEKKWQPAMIFRRDRRFNNPVSKLAPAKVWKKLPAVLNNSGADALFFGGDICDTGSIANIKLLAEGFKELKKPFIYLREDHDFSPWHLVKKDKSEQVEISRSIDGHPAIPVLEYDDLMIIGIDQAVFGIKSETLDKFKTLLKKGKPVILLIHVPLCSANTPELAQRHAWGGKMKMTKTVREFRDLVIAPGSPVKAVFSGHLHGNGWQVKLAPGLPLYISKPAFEGFIGTITVTP